MATDAPAAAPRPAFEGIDSDEVITQISVGKKQVWAINRMGEICWRDNTRGSHWRKIIDIQFKDVEEIGVGPQGALFAVKKDGTLHHRYSSSNSSIAGAFWKKVDFDKGKAKTLAVTDVAIFVASDFGKVFRMLLDRSGNPQGGKWQELGTTIIPISMSSHPVTGKIYLVTHDGTVQYLGLENGPSEIDWFKHPTELWKWVKGHGTRAKAICNTSSELIIADDKGYVHTLPLDGSSNPVEAKFEKHSDINTPVKSLSAFGDQTWFVNGSGEVFAKGLKDSPKSESHESVDVDCAQCIIL